MSNVFFQVLSNNTRTLIYIIPAIALSFLFNVPKFLEVTTREKNGINEVNTSSLRRDPDFIFWYSMYIIWHPTLTTGILPFIVLTYMNTRIYMEIKQSRLVSQTKENFVNYFLQILSGKQSKQRQSEFSLGITLVSIVLMHIVCHSLRSFLGILVVYFAGSRFKGYSCPILQLFLVR